MLFTVPRLPRAAASLFYAVVFRRTFWNPSCDITATLGLSAFFCTLMIEQKLPRSATLLHQSNGALSLPAMQLIGRPDSRPARW